MRIRIKRGGRRLRHSGHLGITMPIDSLLLQLLLELLELMHNAIQLLLELFTALLLLDRQIRRCHIRYTIWLLLFGCYGRLLTTCMLLLILLLFQVLSAPTALDAEFDDIWVTTKLSGHGLDIFGNDDRPEPLILEFGAGAGLLRDRDCVDNGAVSFRGQAVGT